MSITARGGYQIVDFKNAVLLINGDGVGTPVTIPGMYEIIGKIYPVVKPLLLCNFNVSEDGVSKPPIPAYAYDVELGENGDFILFYGTYLITITENDEVTFSTNG